MLSLIPGLVGAPPPLVRRLVGAALPCAQMLPVAPWLRAPSFLVAALPPALGSWALLRPLCDCSWALRRLLLYLPCHPSAPCGFASSRPAARGAPFLLMPGLVGAPLTVGALPPIVTPLPVAPLLRALSLLVAVLPLALPTACGAPLSLLSGHVGASPPLVRLLVLLLVRLLEDTPPPFALPLPVAALLRALSCVVDVPPPAPPLVGVCCRFCPGSWVPPRPLCYRLWALCCPVLHRT